VLSRYTNVTLPDIDDVWHQLIHEVRLRGLAGSVASITPTVDLSEEDRQFLLVHADYFEEKGNLALASLYRDIVTLYENRYKKVSTLTGMVSGCGSE
jgi:hypothetical protein